jgi:hypothetical protein
MGGNIAVGFNLYKIPHYHMTINDRVGSNNYVISKNGVLSHKYVVPGLEKVASVYVAIYDRPGTNKAILPDPKWSTVVSVAQSQNGV